MSNRLFFKSKSLFFISALVLILFSGGVIPLAADAATVSHLSDEAANYTGSLREAITLANADTTTTDTINFDITPAPVSPDTYTIKLKSALPAITGPVTVNGLDITGDTQIILDGSNVYGDGLRISSFDGSAPDIVTIDNLTIQKFIYSGIVIASSSFVAVSNCTITNNTYGIVIIDGNDNTIDSNIITSNASDGIQIGFGTISTNNIIQNSKISGNGRYGVSIVGAASTGNKILANNIYDNTSTGINSAASANTPTPVLTSYDEITKTVSGWILDSGTVSENIQLDFFTNTDCVTGTCEGEVFVESTDITTDGTGGIISFTYQLTQTLPASGTFILTATATNTTASLNTSVFSDKNQAPVNTFTASQVTPIGTDLVFSTGNLISIDDTNNISDDLKITLTVDSGSLTLPDISLITLTDGTGTADSTMTFTGSIANINTTLDGLIFTPQSNSTAAATLTIVTDDQTTSEIGGPGSATDIISIEIASVILSANSVSATEGGTNGTYTINLNTTPASAVTVTLQPDSEVDLGNGQGISLSLSFTDTAVQLVTVIAYDDGIYEKAHKGYITHTVTGDSAYDGFDATYNGSPVTSFTVNITDDEPVPALSINNPVAVSESDGTISFTVTQHEPGDITKLLPSDVKTSVNYETSDNTALAESDYTAIPASTLIISDNGTGGGDGTTTSKTIVVNISPDSLNESTTETFFVDLSTPVTATIDTPQGTGTITDDDPLPVISITTPTSSADEGSDMTFTVTLDAASGRDVTIDYTITDVTTASTDYTDTTKATPDGTLTIIAGSTTGNITLNITDDLLDENAESLTVDLTGADFASLGTPVSATGTINRDLNDIPAISINNPSIIENGGTMTFNVILTGPSPLTVSVDYAVSGSAASADYTTSSTNPLTIAPGNTSGVIEFSIIDDAQAEGEENIILTLSNPSNASLDPIPTIGTGTITDNDISYAITADAAVAVPESAATISFTVTRSGAVNETSSVDFALTGTAVSGTDYNNVLPAGTTINFAAGDTQKTITLDILEDQEDENDETIIVTLSNPTATTGTAIIPTATASVTTTINKDINDIPVISIDNPSIVENGGTLAFNVNLTDSNGDPVSSNLTVSVEYAVSGSAALTDDYTENITSPFAIDPGNTSGVIEFPIMDDPLAEGDENIILTLSNPSNASLDPGKTIGTGTITDNDISYDITAEKTAVPEPVGSVTAISFTITRSGAVKEASSVDFALTGTASIDADYNNVIPTGTTINFAADETQKTISLDVLEDSEDENDETIIVTLSNATASGTADLLTASVTTTITEFLVINEFVLNHAGTDDTKEYIEIKGKPGESYFDYTLLTINGTGVIENLIPLTPGAETTNSEGFWWTGFQIAQFTDNTLTLLLVKDLIAGTTIGEDLDTDDSGSFNITPWSFIKDAIVVSDNSEETYGTPVLDLVGGASRIPDETDTDNAGDWAVNDFEGAGLDLDDDGTIELGTPTPEEALNTPGIANVLAVPGVTITQTDGSTDAPEGDTTGDMYSIRLNTMPVPAEDVTITITPADTQVDLGNGPGTPVSLTFNSANWSQDQDVNIVADDDEIIEENPHTTTISHAASGGGYDTVTINDVTVNIAENDEAGVIISKTDAAVNEEGETTDTYTIVLETIPTSDVTITINADAQIIVEPSEFTFTPDAALTPETFTITANDDKIIEIEAVHKSIISHSTASADPAYATGMLTIDTVTAAITDNDFAGITIVPTDGSTDVEEAVGGGTSDTYSVSINSIPSDTVTIILNTDDGQTIVEPALLTFTPLNASEPKEIKVTAVDDFVVEASPHQGIISHIIDDVNTADDNYKILDLADKDVSVNITENDIAGITFSKTEVNVIEGGATDTYLVNLNTIPTGQVTLKLTAGDQITASPETISFVPDASALEPVTVTITAKDDDSVEVSPHTDTITHAVEAGSADEYTALASIDSVGANITDNDSPGVNISAVSLNTAEGGDAVTYTVKLNTRPANPVTLSFTTDAQLEAIAEITFAADATAMDSQTITVTAVDDSLAEGLHASIINHKLTSDDANYNDIAVNNVSISITDNEAAGVVVTPVSVNADEAGTLTSEYSIKLASVPSAPVILKFITDSQVNPIANLTFAADDTALIEQTVKIVVIDDNFVEGNHTSTISHTVEDTSASEYMSVAVSSVNVSITDNDAASVIISPAEINVGEGGATATYTVKLSSIPSSHVVIQAVTDSQLQAINNITFPPDSSALQERSIIVTAVDDSTEEDSPHASTITHKIASGSAPEFMTAVFSNDVNVKIADNDGTGITVSTGNIEISEDGIKTAIYILKLNTVPANPVTIKFYSGDQIKPITDIVLNETTSEMSIEVTAEQDDKAEGIHSGIIGHTSVSDDAAYNGVFINSVTATIEDDDTPGITVKTSGNSVIEGNTLSYEVSLNTIPSAQVDITLTPDAQIDLGDGPGTAKTIVFPKDDNSIKEITITAFDDELFEGIHQGIISHAVLSSDDSYNNLAVENITISITDNDQSDILINEFVIDHAGDDTHEFIELKGVSGTDYTKYTLLQIDGNLENQGLITSVMPVNNDTFTENNAYYVTGFLTDKLANGTSTLLLVSGFTGIIDTVLDEAALPWDFIADSIAVTDGGEGDKNYGDAPVLTSISGASRIPEGTDTDGISEWMPNDFDGKGLPELTGTPETGEAENTPGNENKTATPTVLTVSVSDATASENAGVLKFQVNLSETSTEKINVDYETTEGNAKETSDFEAKSETLTIPAGSDSAEIEIDLVNDSAEESTETFTITLSNPVNAEIGDKSEATGTITDSDGQPVTPPTPTPDPVYPEQDTPPEITNQAPLNITGTSLTITFDDIKVNDPNYPSGYSLAILEGENFTADGNVITPVKDFSGTLTVPVKVSSRSGESNTFNLKVTINIRPVIDSQNPVNTNEDTSVTVTLEDLNVTDPDNEYPKDFTLKIREGENYTFEGNTITPNSGFIGSLEVPLIVNDGISDSKVFMLKTTVANLNDIPVITEQLSLSLTANVNTLTITLNDLRVSDSDNDYPKDFTLSVSDGINYTREGNSITPAPGFSGTLAVPVTVNDGTDTSEIFNLSVIVRSLPDKDADGLPDSWEWEFGLNYFENDANEDPDGDEFSNLDEYLCGTFPNDKDSSPEMPIADAGPDQLVVPGEKVKLSGLNSTGLGKDIKEYIWEQISGTEVMLSDPSDAMPTFTAHEADANGESLRFQLTIVNECGLKHTDSSIVNISFMNNPPRAETGQDQTVEPGTLVILNASESTDPDNSLMSYQWIQISGPEVLLSDPDTMRPTFRAPLTVNRGESISFMLTVTDPEGLQSDSDYIVNIRKDNLPPKAKIKSSLDKLTEGQTYILDASNSSASSGAISYRWHQISGYPVSLSDVRSARPGFVVPAVSSDQKMNLGFELVIENTDGLRASQKIEFGVIDNGIEGFPSDIIAIKTNANKNIGIEPGCMSGLTALNSVTPENISSENRPENLAYGRIDTDVLASGTGKKACINYYLEEPAIEGALWYAYTSALGWFDFSENVVFSEDRKLVTVTITDGGTEDEDGTANGYVIFLSGLGDKSDQGSTDDKDDKDDSDTGDTDADSSGGGGGGGCFINSLSGIFNY
ncbi:Calx-beta domain-containing protein [Desulfobacterales bacterium HSG17]|nr:Calx-beta domain-containing protein [Desulfobacterales bacterium HSG17]